MQKTVCNKSFILSANFDSLTNNFKGKKFPSAFEYLWRGRNTCLTPMGIRIQTQQHLSPLPLPLGKLWMWKTDSSSCASLWAREWGTQGMVLEIQTKSRFLKLLGVIVTVFCMNTDFTWNAKKNAVFRYSYSEPESSQHISLYEYKICTFCAVLREMSSR